jgi:hypothetical protein
MASVKHEGSSFRLFLHQMLLQPKNVKPSMRQKSENVDYNDAGGMASASMKAR